MTNEDWRATVFARDATIATLTERIRELEASLSTEKASGKRRDESLNRMADEWVSKAHELRARAEKAEARVAELEIALERSHEGHVHYIREREEC